MRHPATPLLRHFDPWAYAKNRCRDSGTLPLAETETLRQWTGTRDDVVHYSLEGNMDKDGQHRLSGRVRTVLHTQCQRCLEPMTLEVAHSFDYVLIRDQSLEDNVTDGSETLICAEDELDLAWFIEEEILLAMPMIAKHDDCSLPQTGARDTLPQAETHNPFAALKDLLETKEHSHGRSTES